LAEAGAGVPGAGYDEHDRPAAEDPSGPSRTRSRTATPTARTPAVIAIEVARLDAGTALKSGTSRVGSTSTLRLSARIADARV